MRSLDQAYLVDGQGLPVPDAEVALGFSDLDSQYAGRDESGYMHRTVLRHGVRTWGFTYSLLTAEEYRYLMELFSGKATFTFTFPEGSCTAYCSKQEVRLFDRRRGIYKALQFTVVEC